MEPDMVEIPPPMFPSASRTRKARKAGIPEVIDVEQYEFRNGVGNNSSNLVDKKNKGKAIQDGSFYDHNPFSHLANGETGVEVVMSTTQPWGFPNSRSRRSSSRSFFNRDTSASSSRPRAPVEVVSSAQAIFLRDFKRFDTVENFSDHHYASMGNASKQHSKTWVKKVQADWKILENDLPETISVRACESRMDLMRAVIVGAEGTPYHDGLFFFDIHFPDTYPSVPPMVHYHSGGLRINPNLYNCGK
ncbi:unnamed protein product, partial [Eruca vesicaria subsp. sativa]|nr:unnamed protein product [Eruca vesicaria subsp. sativa]